MSKRNKRSNQKAVNTDGCFVPFHTLVSTALVAGAVSVLASPNATFSARSLIEADAWAHFRLRKLKFRLLRAGTVGSQAMGFVGGVQDTLPSTVTSIMELIPSTFLGANVVAQGTNWVKVPAKDLAGPLPWYKTIPGTADVTEEAPGYIVFGGGGTDQVFAELKGVFEFKTSVSTGNTPLYREFLEKIRSERVRQADMTEKNKLLKVLAIPTSTPGTPDAGKFSH